MFEYDPAKSAANFAKHGIDFETAQDLWDDERAIEGDTRFSAEERRLLIGRIDGKSWTAVFTRRDGKIRIISARRSRPNETRAYDEQDNQR